MEIINTFNIEHACSFIMSIYFLLILLYSWNAMVVTNKQGMLVKFCVREQFITLMKNHISIIIAFDKIVKISKLVYRKKIILFTSEIYVWIRINFRFFSSVHYNSQAKASMFCNCLIMRSRKMMLYNFSIF